MVKITIISDTHGNKALLRKLDGVIKECDYIIHAGDGAGDAAEIREKVGDKVISVPGNCDYVGGAAEFVTEIGGKKFFITHGHHYAVKKDLERLKERAGEVGADVVVYGHTHCAEIVKDGETLFINPGSFLPRGGAPTYCYAIISGGKIAARIVEIN